MALRISRVWAAACLVAIMGSVFPASVSAQTGYASFQPSQAQRERVSGTRYRNCVAAADSMTTELNLCNEAVMPALTSRLATAYQQATQRLPRARAASLRDGQRVWLRNRYRQCEADLAGDGGGSLYYTGLLICQVGEMERRIIWIEQLR